MEPRLIAGRYALEEPLGEGSWRATDPELGRAVVVRVGAEADVAASTLSHPNIARIFDQGEADGERFVVLEHLPGGSLAERGLLTEESARDVAAALSYAHAQGVAHGSLSAETIGFDEEGRAKVADFGATGEPEDDVRAFGALLAAAGLEAAAAAALAGDLAGATDALRPAAPAPAPAAEPTTQILRPAAAPRSRRSPVLALAVLVALLAAGIGAALLVTADDSSSADEPAGSLSVPVPTGSVASTVLEQPTAPPTTTTDETTTEETTTEETTGETTTERTTTAPPPTTEPPPTTAPPPPTTTEPSPTTTEEATPPPTTTEPG